jgi:hypothetical protein
MRTTLATSQNPFKRERERERERERSLLKQKKREARGVSHCDLAIYIEKYPNAKEEFRNSNISPSKNIIFKKIL